MELAAYVLTINDSSVTMTGIHKTEERLVHLLASYTGATSHSTLKGETVLVKAIIITTT